MFEYSNYAIFIWKPDCRIAMKELEGQGLEVAEGGWCLPEVISQRQLEDSVCLIALKTNSSQRF